MCLYLFHESYDFINLIEVAVSMRKKKVAISVTIDHDLHYWMLADGEKMSRIVNTALRAHVNLLMDQDVASKESPCAQEMPDGTMLYCGYCAHCQRMGADQW